MNRLHRLIGISFLFVLSFIFILQPSVTVSAENEDTVSVDVRVEAHNETFAPPAELEVFSFDLQEYTGGSQPIETDNVRAVHAIIQALEQAGVTDIDLTHGGNYIAGINGLEEMGAAGPLSGWMYYINDEWVPSGVLDTEIKDGDSIVVVFVENYSDNTYSWFEDTEIIAEAGEPFTLELTGVNYNTISPVEDAAILIEEETYTENGNEVVTNENGEISLSIDEPGTYTLTAERFSDSGDRNITRPFATVTVETPPDNTPPVITIEGLEDGMTVTEQSLSFTAEAIDEEDGEIIPSVVFNDELIDMQSDGHFEVQLDEGKNQIEITAEDQANNTAVENYNVMFQPEEIEDETEGNEENDQNAGLLSVVQQALSDVSQFILTNGIVSDWQAIGLVQAGEAIPEGYFTLFDQHIEDQIVNALESGRVKITDIERLTISAVAIGLDSQDINGLNLIELIYNSPEHMNGSDTMTMQGNNGLAFALIALDTLNFEVPGDAKWTRQDIIDELLKSQNGDGSWPLNNYFDASDIDVTGMVLTGLSPYKDQSEVKEALERAVAWLSDQQMDDGGFFAGDFVGGVTSESTSQVVIGLTSYGVDPAGERFTKNGNSLIDHLLSFQNADGGFKHTMDYDNSDSMATEQALQALVAYEYFLEGKGNLYDFNETEEVEVTPEPDDDNGTPGPEEDNNEDDDGTSGTGRDNDENDQGTKEPQDENENEEEGTFGAADGEATGSGNQLPDTATNLFNFIFIGLLLMISGGVLWFIRARKHA